MSQLEKKRLYWVWADMVARCKNPKHKAYKNYGGRGVTVCERWKNSAHFIADMDPRPEGGMLERENNALGYGPDNCRWATRKEQNSNRRNCIYVNDNGERVTLKEFCRRYDMPYRPVAKRISAQGWTPIEALTTPIGCDRHYFGRSVN